MTGSIVRFPKSNLLTFLAVISRGVEYAFMAAGATAAAFAGFESVVIVMRWIGAL